MDRRTFVKSSGFLAAQATFFSKASCLQAALNDVNKSLRVVLNPYANIDWENIQQHKAALHIHTLQSDGSHSVDEVVNSYRNAGYTIMAITDHDLMFPNRYATLKGIDNVPAEMISPYPKDPKPANYPANTTWPWTDYGCSSPTNLGMVGIEGNELSYKHHITSYFNNCGWYSETLDKSREDWNDFELESVRDKGGLALLCHPSWEREVHRHPLEWYIERFEKHNADYLLGIEITNNNCNINEAYDIGLWDQLLSRFMPTRPVWGFGNDDMHVLGAEQTLNQFMLPALSEKNVREAMEGGQFVVCRSTRSIDYRRDKFRGLDVYPVIESIDVDNDKGVISIKAKDCDEIRWISAPLSSETVGDYKTSNNPWQLGRLVHKGDTLNFRNTRGIVKYVRAELHRKDGGHIQRIFTNPFGFSDAIV